MKFNSTASFVLLSVLFASPTLIFGLVTDGIGGALLYGFVALGFVLFAGWFSEQADEHPSTSYLKAVGATVIIGLFLYWFFSDVNNDAHPAHQVGTAEVVVRTIKSVAALAVSVLGGTFIGLQFKRLRNK